VIGSVTQAWQELADRDRRRQLIAEQGAAPPVSAVPPAAGHASAVMPAPAVSGPVPMAAKAAEPDAAKRKRKAKDGKPGRRKGDEPVPGEPFGRDRTRERAAVTDAHSMAEGAANAEMARSAGKSYVERGAQEGPADPVQAGSVEPAEVGRPYIEEGRAAPSPGQEPPRTSPIPAPFGRGILTPIEMPSAPVAAGNAGPLTAAMASHQASVSASPRPPIPGRN
jgi:hypothetical protein